MEFLPKDKNVQMGLLVVSALLVILVLKNSEKKLGTNICNLLIAVVILSAIYCGVQMNDDQENFYLDEYDSETDSEKDSEYGEDPSVPPVPPVPPSLRGARDYRGAPAPSVPPVPPSLRASRSSDKYLEHYNVAISNGETKEEASEYAELMMKEIPKESSGAPSASDKYLEHYNVAISNGETKEEASAYAKLMMKEIPKESSGAPRAPRAPRSPPAPPVHTIDSYDPSDDTNAMIDNLDTVKEPTDCYPKDILAPEDLLPKDSDTTWAKNSPSTSGSLGDQNLLNAGFHVGVNTVGQSLRNANRQLRSDPPNPQVKVSPWMQSTIEPDINRKPLEIGA
jgi:hypothetical protein